MTVHELSRTDARRIAVRAQLLDATRPTALLDVVRHLTLLQIDPVAVVAPNADLVAWSRLGASYSPADLEAALADRTLLELRAMIRPAGDLALYRADMDAWTGGLDGQGWRRSQLDWVRANDACRRDILDPAGLARPAAVARAPGHVPGTVAVDRLDQQPQRHPVAGVHGAAGRGRRRRAARAATGCGTWPSGSTPTDPVVPADEARRIRDERRLRALGIARARGPECPVEPQDVGEAGEPAVVEGVRGTWRVDPAQLGQPFSGRAALLSPFDRLVYDRKRMAEIFEFDYQLEMYKPTAKRRWGYFALPILYGDRLVGKLDATADREAGALRVDAIHQDVPFGTAMTAAVEQEIDDLARWLGLELTRT